MAARAGKLRRRPDNNGPDGLWILHCRMIQPYGNEPIDFALTVRCAEHSCYCRDTSMRKLILLMVLVLLPGAFAQEKPLKKGTYAHFETSMGTFTALLETQLAPKTVANFTGLAQGTKDWKDPNTGEIVSGKAFY